jgi:parvulin-like peptidyl-prolyl isomerase
VRGQFLELIVTDGQAGLVKALGRLWPAVAHQRCWAHKLRNLENKIKASQSACLDQAKLIYQAPHRTEALHRFRVWKKRWQKEAPKAVACLEQDLEELLAFFDCPAAHWKRVRTTNVIERLFVEVRRRIRTMCAFTTRSSCERILYSVFDRMNIYWDLHVIHYQHTFTFDHDWPGRLRCAFPFTTMIGTIRKHSGWLWGVIITATVISFIYWGAGTSRMGDGSGGRVASGDFGSIYGHKVTQQAFIDARNSFHLFYWFRAGEWPDKNPNFSEADRDREIYIRLMLAQKADDLGIYAGNDEVVTVANEMLRSLGRNGQAVPLSEFVRQVLQPKGLTAEDFKNFVRQYLVMEQLQQAIGLTGELVTPQEAAAAYQRDHQELSAQIVFFSASNYLSSVTVAPAAVAQFYTNYLAEYRLPERMQVSYVAFEVTNYLAQARAEWARTNFDELVGAYFRQVGENYRNSKSPAEAKEKIREELIRDRAGNDARKDANDFANAVFNIDPARPENLATVAKQKRLPVHVTAPFAGELGPEEFGAPPAFTKAAFGLTPDEPFARPVAGPDAVYVLAFANRLPSEIPPFDQIRERVTQDYQWREAVLLARHAGTNFVRTLTGMTADRGFASLCIGAGLQPRELPAFSSSTQELPELGERTDLSQLKQAAFTTPVGKSSDFEATSAGGFIVYVQSRLPIDQAKMNSELPQYIVAFRRGRQNEAFTQWVNLEANRELRTTPVFRQQFSPGAPK